MAPCAPPPPLHVGTGRRRDRGLARSGAYHDLSCRGMKTQYYTACSLDGFIATDDHSLEWLFPLGDINDTSYPVFIRGVGALAMGSSTYEWMLRHVVGAGAAWPYPQPAWVFSSRELPGFFANTGTVFAL